MMYDLQLIPYKAKFKTGSQPHPPDAVSEVGLGPSSTWPIEDSMVGGGGLQPPCNSPSAVPSTDHALSGCLPKLQRPNDCNRAHNELYHLPVYLFIHVRLDYFYS